MKNSYKIPEMCYKDKIQSIYRRDFVQLAVTYLSKPGTKGYKTKVGGAQQGLIKNTNIK